MQLSAEELRAVVNGQAVRCVIPGSNLQCVVLHNDLFDSLRLPVSVVEEDLLNGIYRSLSQDSPDDWRHPSEWDGGAKSP